jgi:hypothetical protein
MDTMPGTWGYGKEPAPIMKDIPPDFLGKTPSAPETLEKAVEQAETEKELPPYVAELATDLDLLIEIGSALRSLPERDMVPWFEGHRDDLTPNNYRSEVRLVRSETSVTTKKFEVEAPSGTSYTLVVEPAIEDMINYNKVKIQLTREYKAGPNEQQGVLIKPAEHKVAYLLPLVARLPLKTITYDALIEFLREHNGFEEPERTLERTKFTDWYEHGTTTYEIHLNVHKLEDGGARLELEVLIPDKKRVRTYITKEITLPVRNT